MTHSPFHRNFPDASVLPDGTVMINGGSEFGNQLDKAVRNVEIWDPKTEVWTTGASSQIFRAYHSSSALLSNGAVFTGGGGLPGPLNNTNFEVYFPPYFFQREGGKSVLAERPRIMSMDKDSLKYGDLLALEVGGESASIVEVSFIALSVTTHHFDSNQRSMKLSFSSSTSGLSIEAPPSLRNGNLASSKLSVSNSSMLEVSNLYGWKTLGGRPVQLLGNGHNGVAGWICRILCLRHK